MALSTFCMQMLYMLDLCAVSIKNFLGFLSACSCVCRKLVTFVSETNMKR